MSLRAEAIAAAFTWACLTELEAPKPGNVHVFAAGHNMTAEQFRVSADAAAGPLSESGASVGTRIERAVAATFAAVGANTNLGIILLCAPLAAAAERAAESTALRDALGAVLRALDVDDAALAFRAIVRAAPAGLGRSARHDVFAPATVGLREAMAEAAERDLVARQYTNDFADVFDLGLPRLEAMIAKHGEPTWAALAAYLGFLSAFPDSHIVRKRGAEAAATVRRDAVPLLARLQSAERPAQLLPDLLLWDAALKAAGINPGTSADLTVATLFAFRLRTVLPTVRNSD